MSHRLNPSKYLLLMSRIVALDRRHFGRVEGSHFRGTPIFLLDDNTTDLVSTSVGQRQHKIRVTTIIYRHLIMRCGRELRPDDHPNRFDSHHNLTIYFSSRYDRHTQ